MLILTNSGCAIHYYNARTGDEYLWGTGRLKLKREDLGGGLASVVSGSSLPGLILGVGQDHFGLSFGLLVNERLLIVETNLLASLSPPAGFVSLPFRDGAWGIGQLHMRATAERQAQTIISGRAIAGVKAHLGRPGSAIHLGLDSRQATRVGDNSHVVLTATNSFWPRFDLFKLAVQVAPEEGEETE